VWPNQLELPLVLALSPKKIWWIPQFLPISRNIQIAGVDAICWAIWKMRNRACFEGKNHPKSG
jgi:hypothetical protein